MVSSPRGRACYACDISCAIFSPLPAPLPATTSHARPSCAETPGDFSLTQPERYVEAMHDRAMRRYGALPRRSEAVASGVNERLQLAGDVGMSQGRL